MVKNEFDTYLENLLASINSISHGETTNVPTVTLHHILSELIVFRQTRNMDKQSIVDFVRVFTFQQAVQQIAGLVSVYANDVDCDHIHHVVNAIKSMEPKNSGVAGSA